MPSPGMTQASECRSRAARLERQRPQDCGDHAQRSAPMQQPGTLTQHTCDCLAARKAARLLVPCRLQPPAGQHALTASICTWRTRGHITGELCREAACSTVPPQTKPINTACFGPPGRAPTHQLSMLQVSHCPGSVPCSLQDPAQISSPGTPETALLWGLRPKVATGAVAALASATPSAPRSPETVRGLMPCKHMADC